MQEADLARPEAAEAAGAIRGRGEHFHRNYLPVSTRLLVNGNYIAHVDAVQRDAGDDEADAGDLPAATGSA